MMHMLVARRTVATVPLPLPRAAALLRAWLAALLPVPVLPHPCGELGCGWLPAGVGPRRGVQLSPEPQPGCVPGAIM